MSSNPLVGPRLEFLSDAAEFLDLAGPYLASDPVVSTVVTTVAHRAVARAAAGVDQPVDDWWLVVRDEVGKVAGVGMRTAPFEPRPLFLLPMPEDAAVELARVLHERGEEVLAVNGALPAVEFVAAELARLNGGDVEVVLRTRLHELGDLVAPQPVAGQLVPATESDLELAIEWFDAFMGDADEQAGRPRGSNPHESPSQEEMLNRLREGRIWLWLDDHGTPVHLTAANAPAFGVARVGPVYTPPEQRGRGWASSAVAEVSRQLQVEGARVCLYTDQANPTSNKIYERLGYRPVVDMANLVIVR